MSRLLLVVALLVACAEPTAPRYEPSPFQRAKAAIDSLNAALSAVHASGGSVTIQVWEGTPPLAPLFFTVQQP